MGLNGDRLFSGAREGENNTISNTIIKDFLEYEDISVTLDLDFSLEWCCLDNPNGVGFPTTPIYPSTVNGNFELPATSSLFSTDFRLDGNSPCVDSGDESAASQFYTLDLDFYEETRVSGSVLDIGADEF